MNRQLFASDNASAVHPAVLKALSILDGSHYWAYGDDPDTKAAEDDIRELFDCDCGVYFVYNGTGANTSALTAVTNRYQAVICTEMAHINEDECGAVEAFGGFKLLGVPAEDGKLTSEHIRTFLPRLGFEHTSQPAVVSLTQATEIGTVYTADELTEVCATAHDAGMPVHMDGARIANAAVAQFLGGGSVMPDAVYDPVDPPLHQIDRVTARSSLRRITRDAGVDILSFGATKNGLMVGEAVVFFNRDLEKSYRFVRKQSAQLHSKMRYIAAQFSAIVRNDLWFTNAMRANMLAQRLSGSFTDLPGFDLAYPTEANGVFVSMPQEALETLREEFGFYIWNQDRHEARLMVSYDTEEAFIERFIRRAREYAV